MKGSSPFFDTKLKDETERHINLRGCGFRVKIFDFLKPLLFSGNCSEFRAYGNDPYDIFSHFFKVWLYAYRLEMFTICDSLVLMAQNVGKKKGRPIAPTVETLDTLYELTSKDVEEGKPSPLCNLAVGWWVHKAHKGEEIPSKFHEDCPEDFLTEYMIKLYEAKTGKYKPYDPFKPKQKGAALEISPEWEAGQVRCEMNLTAS